MFDVCQRKHCICTMMIWMIRDQGRAYMILGSHPPVLHLLFCSRFARRLLHKTDQRMSEQYCFFPCAECNPQCPLPHLIFLISTARR